jgi:SpoVK/Ycf46/Vps4 family AAA+-type ATPase
MGEGYSLRAREARLIPGLHAPWRAAISIAPLQVNSAQLVSKWVGEGAQNIVKLFEEAREHEAVLLFDEADSLFAGRIPVGSSSDRYANMEVAVLLSAMERFPGVVILTTNLSENIDDAFLRRLRFKVEFGLPDLNARRGPPT